MRSLAPVIEQRHQISGHQETLTIIGIGPRRPHVLVIDEAPAILVLLRELLEAEGLRVSTRADLPASMDEIKRLQPSLIIWDPCRPGQAAGWALLQALKLDPDTGTVPIVVCTGTPRDLPAPECRLATNVAVVRKPFDIDTFLGIVADALRSPVVP